MIRTHRVAAIAFAAFVLCASGAAAAQAGKAHDDGSNGGHGAHAAPSAAPATAARSAAPAGAAASATARGEVRKVDRAGQKLTLRHEAIPALDMTPMTMVFPVARPALLEGLAVGDRVTFEAERVNGEITVTRVERGAR